MTTEFLTISGTTCSGKTTLEAELVKLGYGRVISTTSRPPRSGEVEGVDYHFVSAQYFQFNEKHFIEQSKFGDHHYGIQKSELDRLSLLGFDKYVAVVDIRGANSIAGWCQTALPFHRPVMLDVPYKIRCMRLLNRFKADSYAGVSNATEVYADRLTHMVTELNWERLTYGYAGYELIHYKAGIPASQVANRILNSEPSVEQP